MNNNYFNLLIDTQITANLFNKNLKNYLDKHRIPCNVFQIILLHLVKEGGDTMAFTEIKQRTKDMATNCTYNMQALINNGYLKQSFGKDLGGDRRCVFFDTTCAGDDLHKEIFQYTEKELVYLKDTLGWNDNNLEDYTHDLKLLQDSIRGNRYD